MKIIKVIILGVILGIAVPAFAEQRVDEIDHVALATRLFKDAHYDRARTVLKQADPAKKDFDLATYHTLAGLLALEGQFFAAAVEHFDNAIRFGKIDDIVFVYLAQGYWGLKDYKNTVRAVDNADEEGEKLPRLQLIKVQSLMQMQQPAQAWEVLRINQNRFPEEPEFDRRAMFLLIELGLYQEAVERSQTYLQRTSAKPEDHMAIGEALRQSGQLDLAIQFLEQARLVFPAHAPILVQLAHAYVVENHLHVAADLFQRASVDEPKFVLESAELYRRAGAFQQALFMNAGVVDQYAKIRQRVAILLDMQRYEAVVALESRAERLGLFSEQPVLYALAFARFSIGDYRQAERLLKKITDPALFRNATQIRRAMAACSENPEAC